MDWKHVIAFLNQGCFRFLLKYQLNFQLFVLLNDNKL